MLSENTKIHEDYFKLRSVAESTKRIYKQALDSWDSITNTPIQNLEKELLTDWFSQANKKLSPSSIDKYGQMLRIFYAFTLEKDGLCKRKA